MHYIKNQASLTSFKIQIAHHLLKCAYLYIVSFPDNNFFINLEKPQVSCRFDVLIDKLPVI
jgi:hypothetical protein